MLIDLVTFIIIIIICFSKTYSIVDAESGALTCLFPSELSPFGSFKVVDRNYL